MLLMLSTFFPILLSLLFVLHVFKGPVICQSLSFLVISPDHTEYKHYYNGAPFNNNNHNEVNLLNLFAKAASYCSFIKETPLKIRTLFF